MDSHCTYVWENYVLTNEQNLDNVLMIAHSAGGYCADVIIRKYPKFAVEKIKALALTDACHGSFDKAI